MYEKLISACDHYAKTGSFIDVMLLLPNNVLQCTQIEKLMVATFIIFIYENQILTPTIYTALLQESVAAGLYPKLINACYTLGDAHILCASYVHSLMISSYPEELGKIFVIMRKNNLEPAVFLAQANESVTTKRYLGIFEQLDLMGWLNKAMIEHVMTLASPKEFIKQLTILYMANQLINPHSKASWLDELFAHAPEPRKLAAGLIALLKLNPKLFNQFNSQLFAYRLKEYSAVGVLLEILSGLSPTDAASSSTHSASGYMSQNVFDCIVQCGEYEWLVSAAAMQTIWPAISADEIDAALPALLILSIQPDSLARAEQLIKSGHLTTPVKQVSVSNHVLQVNRNSLAQNGFFAREAEDYSTDEYDAPAAKKAKYKEPI